MQDLANHSVPERNFGLDLARAFAILFVLVSHISQLHYLRQQPRLFDFLGYFGVEIFFVLSGYLVGGAVLEANTSQKFKFFRVFYIKRFFRTLPAFYVMVLITSFFVNTDFWTILRTVLFVNVSDNLERLRNGLDPFFVASWSLAVEEWFYLLLPGVVILCRHEKKKLEFIFFALLLMRFLWINIESVHYKEAHYSTWFRFDALFWGLYLKMNFGRFNFKGASLLGLSLVILGALVYYYYSTTFPPLMLSLFFPLLSLGITLCIPWVMGLQKFTFYQIFEYLAKISYSLYLVNALVLQEMASRYGQNSSTLLAIAAILICASLLYYIVERPFMKFRYRLLDKN